MFGVLSKTRVAGPPPPPPGLYPNGYSNRRWLRVAGDKLGSAQTFLPLWFDETWPELRSTANGGFVTSSTGADIRFEVGGTAVAYEREVYSPATGRVAGWLDCSDLVPGVDLDVAWYYGKAGVADEQAPSTLWGAALASWRMPDGREMRGSGRNLAPAASGVSPGSILGLPAAVLTTAGYLELTDPSVFTGMLSFTLLLILSPTALPPSGNYDFLRVGPVPGSGASWTVWLQGVGGTATTRTNTFGMGGKWANGQNPNFWGPTGAAVLAPTVLGFSATDGALPEQWIDGSSVDLDRNTATAGSGGLTLTAGDPLRVGATGGGNPLATPGAYGRILIIPSDMGSDWWAFVTASIKAPRTVYGIGDDDPAAGLNRSPILGPSSWAANVGTTATLDVLAHASDPDGTPIAATVEGASAIGATVVTAGTALSYDAPAGTPGGTVDTVPVGADDGTKKARATVTVVVSGSVIVGGGGKEGLAPDFPAIDSAKVVNCTPGTLQSTYNALPTNPAGWTICVNFFGFGNDTGNTVGGSLTFGKSGSASAPIAIRAGLWNSSTRTFSEPRGAANGAYFPDSGHPRGTASFTGGPTVSGAYNHIRGLRWNGGAKVTGKGNRFNRCFFDGVCAIAGQGNLVVDTGDGSVFDWCEWANFAHVGLQHLPAGTGGAKNSIVYRCYMHDQTDDSGASGAYHMLGTGYKTDLSAANVHLVSNITVLDCLYAAENPDQTSGESWECKTSSARQIRCHTSGTQKKVDPKTGAVTHPLIKSNVRHGFNNHIIVSKFSRLIVRGNTNYVADCVTSVNLGIETGDITYTDWIALDYATGDHSDYPNAEITDIVRCDANTITLGDVESHRSGKTQYPPTGTKFWDCTNMPPTIESHGGTPKFSTGTGNPPTLMTSFTIPSGGTWVLKATRDLALLPWPAGVKVGPNASYSSSDDS